MIESLIDNAISEAPYTAAIVLILWFLIRDFKKSSRAEHSKTREDIAEVKTDLRAVQEKTSEHDRDIAVLKNDMKHTNACANRVEGA